MMKELSMHIMDITQNSVRAGAKNISIDIIEDTVRNIFSFAVTDDGCGMTEEFLKKVRDPFATSRTTRRVGLGIPFLEQTCEQCGGSLTLTSKEGEGTYIKAVMEYNNIDRPPSGDLEESVFLLILMNPGIMFKYAYEYNGERFELDMKEVFEVLGNDISLDEPDISSWLRDNIREGVLSVKSRPGGF